jgi:hypothetical protein
MIKEQGNSSDAGPRWQNRTARLTGKKYKTAASHQFQYRRRELKPKT